MLINAPRHIEVLAQLAQAPFEFYLTGSRYFGYDTSESDWDFFLDWAALDGASGLENWLKHAGFYRESNCDYSASTTGITQIWKHGIAPVHIQVVEDARTKSDVQSVLNSDSRLVSQMGKLSKEGRKALWNAALAAFSEGAILGSRPRW